MAWDPAACYSQRMSLQRPVIWWIRRDLRLGDNPALAAALAESETVIPLFVLDAAILNAPQHRARDEGRTL